MSRPVARNSPGVDQERHVNYQTKAGSARAREAMRSASKRGKRTLAARNRRNIGLSESEVDATIYPNSFQNGT